MVKFILSTLVWVLLHCILNAQTTVHRKIAQRHDDFLNNNWEGKDSILFNYSNDAILTQQTNLKFQSNAWGNLLRNTFSLSSTGKILTHLREVWNGTAWVNNAQYTYTYDASDNLTLTLYEIWNGTAWSLSGKIENTGYNSFGVWSQQLTYTYNGVWQFLNRITQVPITGTNKVQSRERENWNAGTATWSKLDKHFYTYNQDSISSIVKSLPDSSQNWKSAEKYIYNYVGNPQQLESFYAQYWNADSNKFIDTTRILNTYNANQKIEQSLQEKRIGYNSWSTMSKQMHYYNGINQLIEKTLEVYTNTWENKDRYLYDYTGNLVNNEFYYEGIQSTWNLKHKVFSNYDVYDNLIFQQREDYNGAIYTPVNRAFYYYSTFVVGLQNINDSLNSSQASIFPNPATTTLNISTNTSSGTLLTISVYDAMGQLRFLRQEQTRSTNFTTQINTNHLAIGNYFVEIKEANGRSPKVIKFQVTK